MFLLSSSSFPLHSHIIQQGSCGQKPVFNTDLYAFSIIHPVDAQAGAVVGEEIVSCRSTFIKINTQNECQVELPT